MFSGIVEEIGSVKSNIYSKLTIWTDTILQGMKLGDSISVDGVCLTIIENDEKSFSASMSEETSQKTNLSGIRPGSLVNLERPLAFNERVGGHLVQGHIDEMGTINSIKKEDFSLVFSFSVPKNIRKYIVPKGSIAVDGISLTVVQSRATDFTVAVIPYTRDNTTLGGKTIGDTVNIEVDLIGKYIENLLTGR
jgi:riboflavin synthase